MKYCLGTVQFGLKYGIQGNGQPQKEKAFEMLEYAVNSGIDMLDTASAYGEAETVLGEFIRSHPESAKKAAIVSKLKPDAFSDAEKKSWDSVAVQNAEASLNRLGIDRFAVYLFHNAAYIFDPDAVAALYSVREQGLADRIGVSIYSPEEAMKALEYPAVSAIQIPYNLFDQRLDSCGFFRKAREQNVQVFARSSLLQGLVMMDPDSLPSRVSFAEPYIRKLLSICEEHGIPPLETAVGYVGGKNEIDYVVFGADNITQLKQYISIRDTVLPHRMLEEITDAFAGAEERLVNPVLWK